MRSSKDLLIASREYAQEQRGWSWFHLATTLLALSAAATLACLPVFWPLRLVGSIGVSLILMRMFILYHDYEHGSILQNSRLAQVIMTLFGWLLLSPPKTWKHAHDHHHQHNAQTFSKSLGTYPVMTTEDYARASHSQRFFYALIRNPVTLMFGYATVFLWEICIHTLIADRRRFLDIMPALLLHAGLIVLLALLGGWPLLLFGLLLPVLIATAMGSYLFYAQHNYPAARFADEANWDYTFAALHSSSFCRMSRLMHWFTGNIGYHHVHHLNSRIPFYRLPEAMAGLPELQSPGETSLLPHDVLACLRLKLWDAEAGRLVTFREARQARQRAKMAACPAVSPAKPRRSRMSSPVLVVESSSPKAAPGA